MSVDAGAILALSRGVRNPEDDAAEARLHHLFEAQARANPNAPAVLHDGVELSYGELNRRANRLAHRLRDWGVQPETVVGIGLGRRPELLVALVAVLKAGGACLPLDPDYPQERLRFILDEVRPAVLLCENKSSGLAAGGATRVVNVDADEGLLAAGNACDPSPAAGPDHAAFVLYTSGSTGRPKGVVMTHGGRGRRQLWTQRRYPAAPADRHLVKSPIGFGTLIREVFWPLTTGGAAVLARDAGQRDAGYLARLIADARVTIASFVPSLLRELLAHPALERCTHLRHVFSTGEALPDDLPLRFAEMLPHARLHAFYGSSEIPTATYWDYEPGGTPQPAPLGRPPTPPCISSTGTLPSSPSACLVRSTSAGRTSHAATSTDPI